MKLVLPKEHGTWAMVFIPYLLGVVFTKVNGLAHLAFFFGWFFIYLSATPWLNMLRNKRLRKKMRPWAFSYTGIGLLFVIPIMIVYPKLFLFPLAIVPFFLVNIYFLLRKNERHLLNDISGIALLSLGLIAAYIIGTNEVTMRAIALWLVVTFFFTGSAFYVKSVIRERKNKRFRLLSHLFHVLLLIVPWVIGYGAFMWVYLPSALRDFFTPRGKAYRPIVFGMIEIVTSVVFFISMIVVVPFV